MKMITIWLGLAMIFLPVRNKVWNLDVDPVTSSSFASVFPEYVMLTVNGCS